MTDISIHAAHMLTMYNAEPRPFVVKSVSIDDDNADYVTVTFRSRESIEREQKSFAAQLAALAALEKP